MAVWSDKIAKVTQSAISKSKEVAGVTKLNMEVGALNQDIRNIQTQVGAYVLNNGLLLEDSFVAGWAEKVNAHKADIDAKNEKIMELKNIAVCPGCGREVSRDNRFCEHCGTEIVIKTAEEDGAEASVAEPMAERAAEAFAAAESETVAADAAGESAADKENGKAETAAAESADQA